MISWSDFENVDMRVGVVVDAKDSSEAKKPASQVVLLRPDEPVPPGSRIG